MDESCYGPVERRHLEKKTNLSIIEQRESLPIYGFKEALIQAIHDNQIFGR